MPTKKLVVSTYLQYILLAVGALLLFTFVRQLGGVSLPFLLAGVLAYALNPLIRRLEALGVPGIVAVLGVFLGLTVAPWGKAPVSEIPAGSEGPTAAPGEARRTGPAGAVRGGRPAVGDGR